METANHTGDRGGNYMLDGKINSFVEARLDFIARRQQLLSKNIANLDTPDYKAQDLKFDEEFASATSAGEVFTVDRPAKPNGNSVDLEDQMTSLAKNGLEYVLLVQYLNSDIKSLRYAITEGR
jgi:flagellar basal-body rod protein FlgB